MTVEFLLPNLGEGVESADVAEILVQAGDAVQVGQPLMELETEKAVMEVPSSHAGTIRQVHIKEGETVKVGQRVATIETARQRGSHRAGGSDQDPGQPRTATGCCSRPRAVRGSRTDSPRGVRRRESHHRLHAPESG